MTIASSDVVLVVGAGIMGAGIAQTAAQAGHPVLLFDTRAGAAREAVTKLAQTLEGLAAKGKISAADARDAIARIEPVDTLASAATARLVVEAIVEKLDIKRGLFGELEGVVADDCILATNTSSISVTAIGNGLRLPQRLVGMHFFNPVPLMKLVEVVSGLQTSPEVAQAIFELSRAWRKEPVHAKSTPGFIVNRIARPYYAETLALLQEQASDPATLDACLRGAGFKMGPCELMDLIGHDTNFSVTQSVYDANFQDKRYVPSLVQRELVDGGLLGRKSGRGFYTYPAVTQAPSPLPVVLPSEPARLEVHGQGKLAEVLAGRVAALFPRLAVTRSADGDWVGLQIDNARLALTDGRCAYEVSRELNAPDLALFDRPLREAGDKEAYALAYAINDGASERWAADAPLWIRALGWQPMRLQDRPGLVVARTVAMLVNEAADAVQQGVCSTDGANVAMKLGVNYPAGPFEWMADWSCADLIALIESLDHHYRGERYRVSPWLRRYAAAS